MDNPYPACSACKHSTYLSVHLLLDDDHRLSRSGWFCRHPSLIDHVVTGVAEVWDCYARRNLGGWCGINGTFWEARKDAQ